MADIILKVYLILAGVIGISLLSWWGYCLAVEKDSDIRFFDSLTFGIIWPVCVVLLGTLLFTDAVRPKTEDEKRYYRIKKLKGRSVYIEAAIIVEDEEDYITGKPMKFENIKNWKKAQALVENILTDEEACFAISLNSRGYLPDDRAFPVHSIQFTYRSDKTDEVLSVETYNNHSGPSSFFSRSWEE